MALIGLALYVPYFGPAKDWWASLAPETRDFVYLVSGFVGGPVAVLLALLLYAAASRQENTTAIRSYLQAIAFPFDVYFGSQIESLAEKFREAPDELPYLARLPGDRQRLLQDRVDGGSVLLLGRQGVGKTREAIESLRRLAASLGDDLAIWVPRSVVDAPAQPAPPGATRRTIVLFLNDVQDHADPISLDPQERTIHDRINTLAEWLTRNYPLHNVRFLLTARSEPEFQRRLRLTSDFWTARSISRIELPDLHRDVRLAFVRTAANFLNVSIDADVAEQVAQRSDGTMLAVLTPLRRHQGRSLTAADLSKYRFTHPDDWVNAVFFQHIATNRTHRAIFQALAILRHNFVTPYTPIVLQLAREVHTARTRFLFSGRKLGTVISEDLRAWMFVNDGILVSRPAYLDQIPLPTLEQERVERALSRALRRPDLCWSVAMNIADIARSRRRRFDDAAVERLLHQALTRVPDLGAVWVEYSRVLLRRQALDAAVEAAERAVAAGPDEGSAYLQLSRCRSAKGDTGKAITASQQATAAAPDWSFGWLSYGVTLTKAGRYEEALIALRKALALDPTNCQYHYSLGIALERRGGPGDKRRSVSAYKQAIRSDRTDSRAWLTLGISLDRQRRRRWAVACFRTALEFEREFAPAMQALLWSLEYINTPEAQSELLATAESLARLEPSAANLCRLGSVQAKLNDYPAAIESARRALKLEPGFKAARRSLAFFLALGTPDDAREGLTLLQELAGDSPTADDLYRLSVAYGKLEGPVEAIDAARRSLQLEAAYKPAMRSLAINLTALGNANALSEAVGLLEKLAVDAATAEDWCLLSVTRGRLGEHELAVSAARKALVLQHGMQAAMRSLAINLGAIGDEASVREGLSLLEGFIRESPSAEDFYRLSAAHARLGQYDRASASALNALKLDSTHEGAWAALSQATASLPSDRRAEGRQAVAAALSALPKDELIAELRARPDQPNLWRVLVWSSIGDDGAAAVLGLARAVMGLSAARHGVFAAAEELRELHPATAAIVLELLLKEEPASKDNWLLYAVVLRDLTRYDEALAAHRRAIALDAGVAPAWYALGKTSEAAGQPSDALSAYREALRINPRYAKAKAAVARLTLRASDLVIDPSATRGGLLPENEPGA